MNLIPLPSAVPLDSCLKTFVRVNSITPTGMEEARGLLIHVLFGWRIVVVDLSDRQFEEEDVVRQLGMGNFLPFIGEDRAIVQITQGNRLAFENPFLPQPYPIFDIHAEDDLMKINELRMKRFGPGFEYTPEHINDLEE